jgi:FlaA1/EpsC-like NDP-sugar epimerase
MINLSGLRPFEDMEIVFTGLRPGEKLFEELELDGEEIAKTRHPKIFIGRIAPLASAAVERALRALQRLARSGDPAAIRDYLNELLPEANLGGARSPAAEERGRRPLGEPLPISIAPSHGSSSAPARI